MEIAAKLFCRGYWFAEAMRVLGLHGRRELLESVVDAGLVEGLGSMTELLAECRGQIGAQVPRLRELRRKKAEDPRMCPFPPKARLLSTVSGLGEET